MGSSGDKPPRFDRWLAKMGVRTITYNDRDIQSVTSTVCGLYAVYFAMNGLPQDNHAAWSFLSTDVENSDIIIKSKVVVY